MEQFKKSASRERYQEDGYVLIRNCFCQDTLEALENVLQKFHSAWLKDNEPFYLEKAVNSAYLTGPKYLDNTQRNALFTFISSHALMGAVKSVFSASPCFLNTQLFFDPANVEQKNYWHRDPQYHLSLEEQKQALAGPNVVHFRVPLRQERGIELVPGTHARWDSEEELAVRLEQNGRKVHEDLSSGLAIELYPGDLLIFSANMIHRGLYGKNRLALDVMFTDPDPSVLRYASADCLPDKGTLSVFEDPTAFVNTMELKKTI